MMTPTDELMFSMISIPQIDSQSTSGEWGRYVEFVFLGKDGVITVEMCYIKYKDLNILEVYEKKNSRIASSPTSVNTLETLHFGLLTV